MKPLANHSTSTPPKIGQQIDQSTPVAYWSLTPEQLLSNLHASRNGLQPADAEQRLKQYGLNAISAQQQATALRLLLSQFKSPLVLILIFRGNYLRHRGGVDRCQHCACHCAG